MNTRNYTIDYIKILAAVGVVMIHSTAFARNIYPFEGFQLFFNGLLRFAVPFFILSSGYLVKDNMRSLVSIAKLYVLVTILYSIVDPFAREHFGQALGAIQWYLPAMMIILVLTANKSKWWSITLFVLSIGYNLALGRLGLFEPLIHSSARSNWITFLWLFLVGRHLKNTGFAIKSNIVNYMLLIVAGLLSIVNGLIEGHQYYFFAQFIAIVFFIPALTIKTPTLPRFMAGLSMDLFVFHGLFLPLKFFFAIDTVASYLLYLSAICICAAITGYLVRTFDKRVLGGLFY